MNILSTDLVTPLVFALMLFVDEVYESIMINAASRRLPFASLTGVVWDTLAFPANHRCRTLPQRLLPMS